VSLSRNLGTLTSWNPLGHSRPVKGLLHIYIYIYIYIYIHISSLSSSSVICQKISPKHLPKRFLHTVRSRASSFNSHYPLLSLRSSSNFLRRLLPRLLVYIYIILYFSCITGCFAFDISLSHHKRDILTPKDETTILPRNVGHQSVTHRHIPEEYRLQQQSCESPPEEFEEVSFLFYTQLV